MEKLQSMIRPEMNELTGELMRYIASITSEFEHLLPKGWRTIVKMYDNTNGLGNADYLLDLQSDIGGGSFAPAKIKTLENFTELCVTGEDTITDLREMIEKIDRREGTTRRQMETKMFSELCNLPHTACIRGKLREWLRDQCGISPYYGGIRVKFTVASADSDPCAKKMLIAFSGAIEWQDLLFTFLIFRELQKLLNCHFPKNLYTYDLEPLKIRRETRIWLDLLDIKTV